MTTSHPTPSEALERAIGLLGGPSKLLQLLKLRPGRERLRSGHVYHWRNKAEVFPAEYCPEVEAATLALGSVVRCEELNPRVSWGLIRLQPPMAANTTPFNEERRA